MGHDAELRELRRRAYAPDGDIHDDPVALARLAQLEDAARRVVDAAAPAPAPSVAEPAPAPAVAVAAPPAASASPATDPEAPPATRRALRPRRSRRRLAIVWAVSLVMALVVGAAVSWGSMRVASRAAGAEQVAVLAVDPAADWPPFFGTAPEDSAAFADFYGMRPFTAGGDWFGPGQGPCLVVVESSQAASGDNGYQGDAIFTGCGAGTFAATVQFVVSSRSPAALRERFSDGTALQFLLEGDRVVVFAGVSPTGQEAAGA
ncbi:hypothetical protein [Microbacterium sp. 10M-3C3]|uniref:hypothetical protein n=1 Tax=Microbacterium sp. 10M-3C3 TaxID=2483401 RepID=UPI0013DE0A36|nr:hypothetical protein [Microbacterium sp. 10M-3C3]